MDIIKTINFDREGAVLKLNRHTHDLMLRDSFFRQLVLKDGFTPWEKRPDQEVREAVAFLPTLS